MNNYNLGKEGGRLEYWVRNVVKKPISSIADKLSMTRAGVYQIFKSSVFGDDTWEKLKQIDYSKEISTSLIRVNDILEDPPGTYLPYFDVVATGSEATKILEMSPANRPDSMINVGGLMPRAEYVIRVSGNSMTPNYPSGCIIGIRQIKDGYFDYGAVYVIETEDNRFIKRVFKSEKEDHISLYSDNDAVFTDGQRKGKYWYESFQMPLKDIKRVFKVVGAAKSNDHSNIPI